MLQILRSAESGLKWSTMRKGTDDILLVECNKRLAITVALAELINEGKV